MGRPTLEASFHASSNNSTARLSLRLISGRHPDVSSNPTPLALPPSSEPENTVITVQVVPVTSLASRPEYIHRLIEFARRSNLYRTGHTAATNEGTPHTNLAEQVITRDFNNSYPIMHRSYSDTNPTRDASQLASSSNALVVADGSRATPQNLPANLPQGDLSSPHRRPLALYPRVNAPITNDAGVLHIQDVDIVEVNTREHTAHRVVGTPVQSSRPTENVENDATPPLLDVSDSSEDEDSEDDDSEDEYSAPTRGGDYDGGGDLDGDRVEVSNASSVFVPILISDASSSGLLVWIPRLPDPDLLTHPSTRGIARWSLG